MDAGARLVSASSLVLSREANPLGKVNEIRLSFWPHSRLKRVHLLQQWFLS